MTAKNLMKKIGKYGILSAISIVVFLILYIFYFAELPDSLTNIHDQFRNLESSSKTLRFQARAFINGDISSKKGVLTNKGGGYYNKLIIAAIDDDAIYKLGKKKYPFNRQVYADMLNSFNTRPEENIPQMVFFDIIFGEQGLSPEGDRALADSIKNYKKKVGEDIMLESFTTVLDTSTLNGSKEGKDLFNKMMTKEGQDYNSERIQLLKPYELQVSPEKRIWMQPSSNMMSFPVVSPIMSLISSNLAFIGSANVDTETSTVYKIPLIVQAQYYTIDQGITNRNNVFYPSVMLMMALNLYKIDISHIDVAKNKIIFKDAEINGTKTNVVIPVDDKWRFEINFKSNPESGYIPNISLSEISQKPLPDDSIVCVGMFSRKGPNDIKQSPFGPMFGIELNAYALATLMERDFINQVPDWINIVYLLLLMVAVGIMVSRGTRQTVIAALLAVVFPIVLGIILFQFNLVIITFIPILGSMLVLVSVQIYIMLTEQKEKKFIKSTFSSYLNPKLVDILIDNPDMINLGGVGKPITVFFSGVKGLDTIAENVSPKEMIEFLNGYFSKMADIVLDTNGTLDKYIGDAVMAFWNAPIDIKDHALKACQASIRMLEAVHVFNNEQGVKGYKPIHINIGINTGNIVVGNVGSEQQKNYTAIGDAVNLASRVKGLCKFFHVDAIITEFTYELIKESVIARELDLTKVKGKTEPVRIYELIDVKSKE